MMYLPFVFSLCISNGYLYSLLLSYTQNSRGSVTESIKHLPLQTKVDILQPPPSISEGIKDPTILNKNSNLEESEYESEDESLWDIVCEFAILIQCIYLLYLLFCIYSLYLM